MLVTPEISVNSCGGGRDEIKFAENRVVEIATVCFHSQSRSHNEQKVMGQRCFSCCSRSHNEQKVLCRRCLSCCTLQNQERIDTFYILPLSTCNNLLC